MDVSEILFLLRLFNRGLPRWRSFGFTIGKRAIVCLMGFAMFWLVGKVLAD